MRTRGRPAVHTAPVYQLAENVVIGIGECWQEMLGNAPLTRIEGHVLQRAGEGRKHGRQEG